MQAVPLAKEQKDVLVNIILQLAEQSSQEIPTYEAATEEKLGLVKQAATVAEISGDTIEDVKTAVNSLIANLKTADNGKVCKGEIYNYDCAKNVFDKYVRNINSSITVWDVYVAINAQYHDYVRLYSEWFRNINKNELDNKIIESAITFYFKDEDSGSTKTWNYFKTAN